jgi:glycosyltransferase involved in cell wall biosynthesis
MKISIIVPTFNSSATIQDNLDSVIAQKFNNYEILIIDNESTDNTIEIVKKNNLLNVKFIIEKDRGIFDAINKGIKISSGDIISVLHSDDIYNDRNVLEKVTNTFLSCNASIVYGDLLYVRKNNLNSVLRYWKSGPFKDGDFHKGWHPPHPSFFAKKNLFEIYGNYKNDIGNSADVELMHRLLQKNKIDFFYVSSIFVKMRYGGKSNKKFNSIIEQNKQIIKFLEIDKNYYKIIIFFVYKVINRLRQFFSRPEF